MLIFFGAARVQVGMAIVGAYFITVALLRPHLRSRDDTLQLLAQTELLAILLSAHTLEQSPDSSDLMDLVLSVILLLVTGGLLALFAYFAVLHVRDRFWQLARERELSQAKKSVLLAQPAPAATASPAGSDRHLRDSSATELTPTVSRAATQDTPADDSLLTARS